MRRALPGTIAIALTACSLLSLPETGGGGVAATPDATADVVAEATTDGGSEASTPVSYASAVLADNPLLYLPLDEPTGPSVKDATGHGHDGIVKGTAQAGVPGAVGSGVRLPGVDMAYLDLGVPFEFANNAPFTFEVWVSVELSDQTYRRLIWMGDQSTYWYVSVHGSSNTLDMASHVGGADAFGVSFQPFPLNIFAHVVYTYDGSLLTLYLNGSAVNNRSGKMNQTATGGGIQIGAFAPGYNPLKGVVDEIAFYDHALPPLRVLAHYKASGR